jgi:hypothetical protein
MGVVAVTPTQAAPSNDFKTPLVMQGSVNEIRVANPHMQRVLHVSDNKGRRDLELGGHSLNNIYRRGWRVGLVKPERCDYRHNRASQRRRRGRIRARYTHL